MIYVCYLLVEIERLLRQISLASFLLRSLQTVRKEKERERERDEWMDGRTFVCFL